ncbi:response regulator [Pseudoalteromonas denitrificans]|uniref:Response regulator receiver domain-containing protein n=1 Tax=Pseudoalteromonas denitrificans DSM 6059 TaxID=1123010 RepID=A0A1I1ENL5_9GAMM|nr:response regulator [Pseudoalteromonas denitrificans]SFB88691.1 Response regulator receiver domain-containing protein [Pseudoalteromonas denitrificans DSM 6059]
MTHILLVDDEPEVLNALTRILRKDYQITSYNCASEALEAIKNNLNTDEQFDLIISDIRMPHMDGIELLSHINKIAPQMSRVLLSGYADMELCQSAIPNKIAQIILSKPWDNFEIKTVINLLLELAHLKQENLLLKNTQSSTL